MNIFKSNEFKVGLLSVVSMIILYFGFNFLKGYDVFSATKQYTVIYDQIEGLQISNPVMLNGMSIGRVSNIEILPDKNNKIRVTLLINNQVTLKQPTYAVLGSNGLLGGKAIFLEIGTGKVLDNYAELPPKAANDMMATLQAKANPMIARLDSMTIKINALLSEFSGVGKRMNNILANVDGMTAALESTLASPNSDLNALLRNFRTLSANLVETEKMLKPTLENSNAFLKKLNELEFKQTLDKLNKSLQEVNIILEDLNKGKGTAGKVLKDEALYTQMKTITENIDRLLIDLRENPKRYINISIFGGKNKEEK
ncbi:MAG: MCE family protein [Cytophagales bacterium]|nr:MAG: MCE family protein [Cytophagales bacterium]